MQQTKYLAVLLTAFMFSSLPSYALAQEGTPKKGTPEAKQVVRITTGQPRKDGKVVVMVEMTMDEGRYDREILESVDYEEVFQEEVNKNGPAWINDHDKTTLRIGTKRKSIQLLMVISIDADLDPVEKAQKIADRVDATLKKLPTVSTVKCPNCAERALAPNFDEDAVRACTDCEEENAGEDWAVEEVVKYQGAFCGQGQTDHTEDPLYLNEVIIGNMGGFTVKPRWSDGSNGRYSTGEKDRFDSLLSSSFDENGILCSCDIQGAPTGGLVTVEVNDEEMFVIETGMFISSSELEDVISLIISGHPSVQAAWTDEPLDSALDEDLFDGARIEFLENSAESFVIHVDDPGLSVSYDFDFDLEADSLGDTYCLSNVNSTGATAQIRARGSEDATENYLVLTAENVPDQFGIFFSGPNQIEAPFGEGFRCVGGGVLRLSLPKKAEDNVTSKTLDLGALPLEFFGQPVNIQYWYRDPQGGGSNFNLSDAISVTLDSGVAPL